MKMLWRLHPLLREYQLPVIIALATLLGITAAQLVLPTIIKQVIDVGLARGEVRILFQAALLILAIGLLTAVLIYFQRYISEWIAAHIGYDLRNQLYNHIQHLSFTYHDHDQTGQLISRCIEDVRSIERFTGFGVVELIHMVLLFAGVVTLLFVLNARLATIALLPMIPLVAMTTKLGKKSADISWQ